MSQIKIINATDRLEWRKYINSFDLVDATFLPEYHLAYALRIDNSIPILWNYIENKYQLSYPFLLTPVSFIDKNGVVNKTPYFDISSVYGYTGPLANTKNENFLKKAWKEFEFWANSNSIIAEFIRFSPFMKNEIYANPNMQISNNRLLACSYLNNGNNDFIDALKSKTRNMIKKAIKNGLISKELDINKHINDFRSLYNKTMLRNNATDFFLYDDRYFDYLVSMDKGETRLFCVYKEDEMISAAISICYKKNSVYHLGASDEKYNEMGAGNLCIYQMSKSLSEDGIDFLNMTGGRSTSNSDPLLRFKKNNSTNLIDFQIGKRILNKKIYKEIEKEWESVHGISKNGNKIIFWR